MDVGKQGPEPSHGRSTVRASAPEQLQSRALYEVLADEIRERILRHELKPGQAIDELALLEEYGISRTPVREALKVLRHEGLLTARQRRGMSVTLLGPHQREEAMNLRRLLLDHAASQAISVRELPADGLLARMLEMAERQLRLAHGPAFEQVMLDEHAGACPARCRPFSWPA